MRLIREYDVYVSSCGGCVIDNETERAYKIQKSKLGYCQVQKTINGKRKTLLIHRLVAKAFIPNPDNLPEVNHKDGNKANNQSFNLEWCTRRQNAKHAVDSGLWHKKLGQKYRKPERDAEMKALYATGNWSYEKIGKQFGISGVRVQQIVKCKG